MSPTRSRAIALHVPARRSLRRDRGRRHRPSQSVGQESAGEGSSASRVVAVEGRRADEKRGKNLATTGESRDAGKTASPSTEPATGSRRARETRDVEGERTFLRAVNAILNASRCVQIKGRARRERPAQVPIASSSSSELSKKFSARRAGVVPETSPKHQTPNAARKKKEKMFLKRKV